ncbi:MAG: hypothetical protein ACRDTH_19255 [Pseudonocardiaceae bacterium]
MRSPTQPVPDGAGICTTCATALAEQLRGVPNLIENLYITFTKQDRLCVGTGHRGKLAEAPLPVRFDITQVIDAVSSEMTTWARDWVECNGWDVPNPPRRSAHNGAHGVVFYASSPKVDLACYAAEWLADHLGHLRTHPAALDAYRDYPATASVIAGWVGDVSGVLVNRKPVNSWHHRGLIRKVDDDPDSGDTRFRIGEVLDRAAKSKPRKAAALH